MMTTEQDDGKMKDGVGVRGSEVAVGREASIPPHSPSRPGGEEDVPGLFPPPPPASPHCRPRSGCVAGDPDHWPAVLPLYLVHHHQPPRLSVHLACTQIRS